MSSYRLYFLDEQGHISRAREFEARSDAEALAVAEEVVHGQRAELWNRARIVARMEPASQAA